MLRGLLGDGGEAGAPKLSKAEMAAAMKYLSELRSTAVYRLASEKETGTRLMKYNLNEVLPKDQVLPLSQHYKGQSAILVLKGSSQIGYIHL